ncbi:MAG: hypothetical protein AAFN74_08080, partial [Myxococcota bacterium]
TAGGRSAWFRCGSNRTRARVRARAKVWLWLEPQACAPRGSLWLEPQAAAPRGFAVARTGRRAVL